MNFIDIQCPKCNSKFKEEDDVVVCPKCGTPHHRECYLENKSCVNEDKHKDGFVWGKKDKDKNLDEIECKKCSHKNPANATHCENCKSSILENKRRILTPQSKAEPKNILESSGASTFFVKVPPGVSPLSFIGIKPEDSIGNEKVKDFVGYIQNNHIQYLSIFKFLQENKKRNRFNFCAFLFGGFWFLYRKQYKIGAILSSLFVSLFTSNVLVDSLFSQKIQQIVLTRLGISSSNPLLSVDQTLNFYKELISLGAFQVVLYFLPLVFLIFSFFLMLYCGFNANRCYLEHCKKEISKINKESESEQEKSQRLLIEGGINHHVLWISIFVFLLLQLFIISP